MRKSCIIKTKNITKTSISFPHWKPHKASIDKFEKSSYLIRLDYLQKASYNFISKNKKVRDIIFKDDDNKCVICGSNKKLTIDHIIPLACVASGYFPLSKINSRENLRTLCMTCNIKKKDKI